MSSWQRLRRTHRIDTWGGQLGAKILLPKMQKLRVESSKCCFRDAKDAGVMKVQVTLCPDGCCRSRACDDPRCDRLAGAVQRRDHLTARHCHGTQGHTGGQGEPNRGLTWRREQPLTPRRGRPGASAASRRPRGPPDLTALAPSGRAVPFACTHALVLLLRASCRRGMDRRRAEWAPHARARPRGCRPGGATRDRSARWSGSMRRDFFSRQCPPGSRIASPAPAGPRHGRRPGLEAGASASPARRAAGIECSRDEDFLQRRANAAR